MEEKLVAPCDLIIQYPRKNGQPLPSCTDGERRYFPHLGHVCGIHNTAAEEIEAIFSGTSTQQSPLTPKE